MRILTIEQMKERKQVLGYSNEQLALLSGVPESTIQKIFSGTTRSPRRKTLEKLDAILRVKDGDSYVFTYTNDTSKVAETANPYYIAQKRQGEYTVDDYEALPDERRVELIDGVIYDMSAPSTIHQIIQGEIAAQLRQYIRANGGKCVSFVAPTDVQIDCDKFTMVQPDVFVVCNRDLITKKRIIGAPDFIIEIISPSTKSKDMGVKLEKYADSGVKEYWLVNPDKMRISVHYFADEDEPPRIYPFKSRVPVSIFGGECFIDFNEVYAAFSFITE